MAVSGVAVAVAVVVAPVVVVGRLVAPPRVILIVVVHAHGVPRLFGSDA
ncbi:hypothetical protein ACFVGY_03375 [Streptomyces sp. NPDC127106]